MQWQSRGALLALLTLALGCTLTGLAATPWVSNAHNLSQISPVPGPPLLTVASPTPEPPPFIMDKVQRETGAVRVGEVVTYVIRISVQPDARDALANVSIVDTVPIGLTVASVDALFDSFADSCIVSRSAAGNEVVTCNRSRIVTGGIVQVRVRAEPSAAGRILTNTVEVRGTNFVTQTARAETVVLAPTPTATPRPTVTPTPVLFRSPTPITVTVPLALQNVLPSGEPGVPCADAVGQTCQVTGQVSGVGTLTGGMTWTLTAPVPAGIPPGTVPVAVIWATTGRAGFPCTPVVAGQVTVTCIGTTTAPARQNSVATVLFTLDQRAVGSVNGPGPRRAAPAASVPPVPLLPPPPPIVLPPPPPPQLVPVPAPVAAAAPRPAAAAEVPVIPEGETFVLLGSGLLALAGVAGLRRRRRKPLST